MTVFAAKKSLIAVAVALGILGATGGRAAAQTPAVAPTLIPVSGQFLTGNGQPRTGAALLVISLYEGQNDTAPRWVEHQQVTLDEQGRYNVQFGSTQSVGLPADLFTGDASTRWLGVAIENEAEQPRVMLVSVPYAAKAASAEMLAGKPASDFVLASTFREDVRAVLQDEGGSSSDNPTSELVTLNYIQKGDGLGGTTDSTLFETGGSLGIGTTTPVSLVHLRGGANIPAFRLENTEAGAATWQVTSASDGQLRFTEIGQAVRMVINKTTGAVGIGSGSPQSLLHLRAGLNLPAFRLENSEPGGATWQVTSASDGQFRITEIGAAVRFVVDKSSGNIGVGTGAPTSKLHVVGSSLLAGTTAINGATTITGATTVTGDATVSGNIGVGTTSPSAKLHVVGNTTLGGATAIAGATTITGDTTVNGNTTISGTTTLGSSAVVNGDMVVNGNIGAKYQDVAEWVDAAEPLENGSIVIIDPTTTNRVKASRSSYATAVAGAISPQPGLILGEGGPGRVLVAQSGRVRVKADATFGAIKPGDLLVTSPTQGHVMKSKPVKMGSSEVHRPGTLVGKALEALPNGKGEILVLLTLQ